MLDVAIIDDGVNEGLYNLGRLRYNIEITRELEIKDREGYDKYLSNHATTCGAILKKFAPLACISSVKILNDERRGVCKQLVKSIEWCVEKKIKIVNLSIGTTFRKDYSELVDVFNNAAQKGLIVVAACSNRALETYPSSFTNVIGVKTDLRSILKEGEYNYNFYPYDGIDITCCSVFSLLQYSGKIFESFSCNSYATPFVTAKVYDIVSKNPQITVDEVKEELAIGALNCGEKTSIRWFGRNIDWVKKAVVFNLNNPGVCIPKDRLNFKIIDEIQIESDCYCNSKEKIKCYFGKHTKKYEDADTVIINANSVDCKHKDCTSDILLKEMISRGKNVVYIDDREIDRDLTTVNCDKKIKIWHPGVFNKLDIPVVKKIDVPIICVNDFSGTKLLEIINKLEKCFDEDGYNVVSASDTSVACLSGMNYSPVFNRSEFNRYDPARLQTLCGLYNPDIILYGIDAFSKGDYSDYKNMPFEIDVEIIIYEEKNCEVDKFVDFCKGKGRNVILINTCSFFEKNNFESDIRLKIVHMFDKTSVNELYNYIISLYNER